MILSRALLTALLVLIFSRTSFALAEIRTITTRPGVTMDFLIMTPAENGQRDVLILFPGGNGAGSFKLSKEGIVSGWSFLVRSSDSFIRRGLAVVTVNPPSDHSTGMDTGFRESAEHAEDLANLINYLEQKGYQRIFLAGNSRGTLSAVSNGIRLKNSRLKGVILTSPLEYDSFLRWLPLEKLDQPVLMIHHREDICRVSPFGEAEKTRDILRRHTSVDFIEVNGGAYPRSAPCDNLSAHGFFGIEDRVVQFIADWVGGRAVPERIE